MTRTDHKIFFTALAFHAVVTQSGQPRNGVDAARIKQLAGLIDAFCAEHVPVHPISHSDDTGASRIDDAIVVPPTSGASAESVATFIARLINRHQQNNDLLHDARTVLEEVMCDGLTFSTEQAAEHVITSIRQVVA